MLKDVGGASEGASVGSPTLTIEVPGLAGHDGRRMIFWSAFEGYLHSSCLDRQCSHAGLVS